MQDHDIIELYFARNESAIDETRKKYGKYCMRVAMNIVKDLGDAEECVSDTYLAAWNTIPPERPKSFLAYLGKITRNLALSRYRNLRAAKRGQDETALAIDELSELGKTNELYRELAEIVNKNGGLWCAEAEKHLLAHAPKI